MDAYLVRRVALETAPEELLSLCQTDKMFFEVCSDVNFWREKYQEAGVVLVEPQSSVKDYIDDLNNCRNILPIIEAYFETLQRQLWPSHVYALGTKISESKAMNIPSIDQKLIERMIKVDKKLTLNWLSTPHRLLHIKSVLNTADFAREHRWGLVATIRRHSISRKYHLVLAVDYSMDGVRKYRKMEISENDVKTLFYLWIYYGQNIQSFEVVDLDDNFPPPNSLFI